MDDLIKAIINLVDSKGLPYVAYMLGEPTTRNIQNWIKDNDVPQSKRGMIEKILKLEGVFK